MRMTRPRRRVSRPLSAAVLAAVVLGCAPPPEAPGPLATDEIEAALLAADRAFARETSERGIDGWMEFFAEDAARVMGGGSVRGLAAIRELDSALIDPETSRLEWEPTEAGAFSDGRHGFTTGRYTLRSLGEDDTWETASTGTYVSLWRREESGWKVILDTGAPDPPPVVE